MLIFGPPSFGKGNHNAVSRVTTLLVGAALGGVVVAAVFAIALRFQPDEAAAPTGAAARQAPLPPPSAPPAAEPLVVDGDTNPFLRLRDDERTLNWQTRTVVGAVGEAHAVQVRAGDAQLWVGVAFERPGSPGVQLSLLPADGDSPLRTRAVDNPGRTGRWTEAKLSLGGVPPGSYRIRIDGSEGRRTEAVMSQPALIKGARGRPAPNLLLISVDTLRADYLGMYGQERFGTTPKLDARVRGATVFDQVTAPSPWTVPSHTAMLTGTDPDRQGMARQVGMTPRLRADTTTLAERFSDAGYLTAAFTGRGTMAARNGFSDGFYLYQEASTRMRFLHRDLDVNMHAALDWLQDNQPERFFLFFHTFEAHAPYGHARFVTDTQDKVEQAKQAYASGIAYVDQQLDVFLQALQARGLLRNTIVIVTSDHGEGFLEHPPHKEHGETFFEEFIHVPMLMWGPGIPAGRRISEPVGLVDLFATVVDLFGLQPVADIPSRSLVPLLRGEPLQPRDVYLCCIAHGAQKKGLRTPGFKYFHDFDEGGKARDEKLFDLQADPRERLNLVGRTPANLPELRARLQARASSNMESSAARGPDVPPDPDMLEQLRALGYVE